MVNALLTSYYKNVMDRYNSLIIIKIICVDENTHTSANNIFVRTYTSLIQVS